MEGTKILCRQENSFRHKILEAIQIQHVTNHSCHQPIPCHQPSLSPTIPVTNPSLSPTIPFTDPYLSPTHPCHQPIPVTNYPCHQPIPVTNHPCHQPIPVTNPSLSPTIPVTNHPCHQPFLNCDRGHEIPPPHTHTALSLLSTDQPDDVTTLTSAQRL